MKKGVRILFGAAALLFTTAAFSLTGAAQTTTPQSDVFELGEIVVTSTQEKAPAVTTTNEVTAADIEKTGATSVGAALAHIGGVWTTVGNKDELNVQLRGLQQQKVLVLLDGIPVSSPFYGYIDLNQIPVDNIAKITVIKGIASPLYGSDAMGGVINIVTKKQSGKAAGRLKAGYSNNSTYNESVSYYTPIGNKSLSVSAGGSKSDGFELSGKFVPTTYEDGGRRLNSDYDKKDMSLKFGLDSKNPAYINFNYTKNEKGMPVNTITPSGFTAFSRFSNWESWTMDLSREQNFSDSFKLRAKVYYHKFGNTLEPYTDKTFSTIKTNSTAVGPRGAGNGQRSISVYDDYSVGVRLLSDWAVSKNHQLNFSLNALEDNHKNQSSENYPWEKYVTRTYSLGAESTVKLSDRLALVTGVSYDRFEPKSALTYSDTYKSGGTTYTLPLDQVITTARNVTGSAKHAFSPVFGISITPNEKSSFHISVGRKTRFPTQNELFSSTKGNANLKPQKSSEFETGYEYKYADGYAVSFTYFANKVSGLIFAPTSTSSYINMNHSNFEGYEMGLKKTVGRLTGSIMRTYLSARDTDNHVPLTYTPRRKVDYNLGYNFYKSMVFDLFGSYVSPRYSSTTNILPSYTALNAGLSGDLKKLNANWHLYVENINDRNYQEELGFPQPGRTYRGEIEYKF